MANLKRRAFLKAAAVAPLGAQAAGQELALRAAGVTGIGGALASGGSDFPVAGCDSSDFKEIRSFVDWLKIGGDEEIRERANRVERLDPEILCLHLPLTTKIRMQRKANYEREVDERRNWFERRLKADGFVKWWG